MALMIVIFVLTRNAVITKSFAPFAPGGARRAGATTAARSTPRSPTSRVAEWSKALVTLSYPGFDPSLGENIKMVV